MRNKEKSLGRISLGHNLIILSQIYEKNHWPIEDEFDNEYNRFCDMLEILEDNEQRLIIELTKTFLKIGAGEYMKFFLEAFNKFIQSNNFQGKKIFIFPLLRKSDIEQNKSKSSTTLYYLLKAEIKRFQEKYSGYSISLCENPSFFTNTGQKVKPSYVICLVDDFIGTGETAIDAANEIMQENMNKNQINIISLVAQKNGVDQIKKQGYNAFAAELRTRAISDGKINEYNSKKLIMEKIEKKLGVDSQFQFGYGHSEALVKMIRTPNNTFPIYWYSKSKIIKIVPFPR